MTIGGVQQIVRSADNVNLLFQVIEGKQDHCSFECRTAIENETIWIRINAQAYKTKGSKRQNKMICHITNITEEKLLEELVIFRCFVQEWIDKQFFLSVTIIPIFLMKSNI